MTGKKYQKKKKTCYLSKKPPPSTETAEVEIIIDQKPAFLERRSMSISDMDPSESGLRTPSR